MTDIAYTLSGQLIVPDKYVARNDQVFTYVALRGAGYTVAVMQKGTSSNASAEQCVGWTIKSADMKVENR